jgi:hypothetical protein
MFLIAVEGMIFVGLFVAYLPSVPWVLQPWTLPKSGTNAAGNQYDYYFGEQ